MRDTVRHFVAELVGVFALVFLSGAVLAMRAYTNGEVRWLDVALVYGLAYGTLVTATMRVSGHLNPAVTFGMLVARRIEPTMAGVYLVAQALGALLAAYVLRGVIPADAYEAVRGGGQLIAADVNFVQAFSLETIATFALVFVVFGTAIDAQAPRLGGLPAGFAAAAGALAIGPLTGGSLNPARSFGPAVASGVYEGQAVYWLGPLTGGVLAGIVYALLFLRRPPERPDHGALAPSDEGTEQPARRGRRAR